MDRIISFLPSATELLFALKADQKLKGVTHECTHPESAKSKPKIIDTVIDSENLNSQEINDMTCKLMNEGKDIFVLNKNKIRELNPELIIVQNTCEVCAAHTNQIQQAIEILNTKPQIFSMDPHDIGEILDEIVNFAKLIDYEENGRLLKRELETRIRNITENKFDAYPKVLAIEWIEPFFTAGHWVPEMIQISGGINMISEKGEHSKKIPIEKIAESDPDTVIIMPCGFDLNRTKNEYNKFLKNNQEWKKIRAVKEKQIFAVDANSFFSKPSIRTITGVEILAKIIHPEIFSNTDTPENSYARL